MCNNTENHLHEAEYILRMLERLSADSIYAHQASGLRGSILRAMNEVEGGNENPAALETLTILVSSGYEILEKAAAELRGLDDPQLS